MKDVIVKDLRSLNRGRFLRLGANGKTESREFIEGEEVSITNSTRSGEKNTCFGEEVRFGRFAEKSLLC